jgi:hypothetical protein
MEKEKVKPWSDDMVCLMERLDSLQTQVDTLTTETKDMVAAFNAAQGAFQALDWIARTVKPIIVIVGTIAAAVLWFKGVKV